MNTNDKKLTELLERWQSGDFTRADEQELQRLLAEGDDFSRAAAEGYLAFPEENHPQRLDSLRKKLKPASDRSSFFSGRLTALAASFVLLLVAVWWIIRPDHPQQQIAQAPAAPTMEAPQAPAIQPPGNADLAPIAMNRGKGAPGSAPGAAQDQLRKAPSASLFKEDSITPDVFAATETMAAGRAEPVSDDQAKDMEEDNALSEVIIPQPVASPNSGPILDKRVASTPNNVIYEPAVVSAPSKKAEEYDQSTRNMERGGAVSPKASSKSKEARSITGPSPAGGWDKFRSAMLRQLSLPQAAKDNGVYLGTVSMILDINAADGKVRSVLFVNKVGYGCDELAEQFVQKYNWVVIPGGSNEVEVEVTFR